MKKIISIILAALMLISCSFAAFAQEATVTEMKFDENGQFKIIIFADPQDGYPLDEDLKAFMNEALDKTQPDLAIFLGDIVMSPKTEKTEEEYLKGYDEMLQPLVDRNIPISLVFGNHDHETMPTMTKEEMLEKYMSYDGCLAYDADPALHGTGTHNIEIKSSDGTKTAFNLWLMDSGDYITDEKGEKHYDCVRKDQIEWYENKSAELEAANGGIVPSFMFQHVVPADVAQQVMITLPFHIGKLAHYDMADGTAVTYLPNIFGFDSGVVAEGLCPSIENDGQWDAIAQRGDVLACFFGHDHKNTYKANVKGVDAINVPGCTYHAYYDKLHQGAILLTLDESDLSTYKAEHIYSNDLALEEGSKLPTLSRDKRDYTISRFFRILIEKVLAPLFKMVSIFKK